MVLVIPAIAASLFAQVDVFTAGAEGYHTFRIPTIVTAPDTTLIVSAEACKENRSDPGGAIQTRGGRLVVPSARRSDQYCLTISVGGFECQTSLMRAYALFSDDHGTTWKRGALVKAQTNEYQFVELADGAILMDARQGAGTHGWLMHSKDGGVTWSDPVAGQTVATIAASIERYTLEAAGDDRNRLLWTGPKGPGRKHLVIRTSYDEGQTFRQEQTIYGGLAAYSDITILHDKTVGVIWERGVSEGYQFVTFTRLGQAFLESAKQ